MSCRVNKKTVKATNCHICEKAGENAQVCGSHNFRDQKGRVVCESFLKKLRDNQCYKCQQFGHFADKCGGAVKPAKDICVQIKKVVRFLNGPPSVIEPKKKAVSESKTSVNAFDVLGELSDEEDEQEAPPANVTVRKPVVKAKPMSWADYDSDPEDF
jgi:hypothetical protein